MIQTPSRVRLTFLDRPAFDLLGAGAILTYRWARFYDRRDYGWWRRRAWWWRMASRARRQAARARGSDSERGLCLNALYLRCVSVGYTLGGQRFAGAIFAGTPTNTQWLCDFCMILRLWVWRLDDWWSVRPRFKFVVQEANAHAQDGRAALFEAFGINSDGAS